MFEFANAWLLLLILLPIVWFFLPKAKQKPSYALKIPFYKAIENLSQSALNQKKLNIKKLLVIGIWVLIIIAAAGPRWLGNPVTLPQQGRDIMLAVDISGSMRLQDMNFHGSPVSRISLVKRVASNFIEQRKGDRIGLILFGTRAYLQTPLTFDHKTVLQMLNDATIGLAGTETAIGDAIGLAIKRLMKTPVKSRILILLTDGANNSGSVTPLNAAKIAAKEHIKIYTIGLGASQMQVPGLFGPVIVHPTNALDEQSLKEIASITHGLFFRAENASDLEHVYTELDKLIPVKSGANTFRPIKPLYDWPLAAAFLTSLVFAGMTIIL